MTGDETATSFGMDISRFRIEMLVATSVLTGALVAISSGWPIATTGQELAAILAQTGAGCPGDRCLPPSHPLILVGPVPWQVDAGGCESHSSAAAAHAGPVCFAFGVLRKEPC
ncbi:hypothetical protein GCM10009789_35720 [Kribbella sancticallisti]|uniref:Uncharacterized protein n=1 Tax=Kribbella sancticallisti TaxID=460087 RepID=A0ABP4PES4_9ACTN